MPFPSFTIAIGDVRFTTLRENSVLLLFEVSKKLVWGGMQVDAKDYLSKVETQARGLSRRHISEVGRKQMDPDDLALIPESVFQ